jgi:signal transduction histidine kinase
LAVVIVGIATGVASRRVGQREAIIDARTTTLIKAQDAVEPAITAGLLDQRRSAVRAIDRVVHASVLDSELVRVKIWRADGTILYSDQPELEGETYNLGADDLAALRQGVIEAEVSDLTRPENRFERNFDKMLEVYLPVRAPDGTRMLFEAYYKYDAVSASGQRIWRNFAPVTIGSLVALELVQIPIAWSLARRLRDRQREREALLQHALEASDNERRRIAADLHDGVVQDLAGVAFALTGSSRSPGLPGATSDLLEDSARQVRDSIKSLRTLLVDIYPPQLAGSGLMGALVDLAATTQPRGLTATVDVRNLPDGISDDATRLLWRAAQEGLRNAVTHARASAATVTVDSDGDRVWLDVTDDGVGVDTSRVNAATEGGHVGIRGLADLAAPLGGQVELSSLDGAGARLHVEVPLT